MSLVSKKTFRKWAKVLTDRGLTLENFERYAEMGGTVATTLKMRGDRGGDYSITANQLSFRIGAVYLDGALVGWDGGKNPGDTYTLTFNPNDARPKVVYCELNFVHHGEYNYIDVDQTPDPYITEFYTPTRAVADGHATFGIMNQEDFIGEEVRLDAVIDTDTNTGDPGYLRKPVALLEWIPADPPLIPNGYWRANDWTTSGDSPARLIVFNLSASPGEDGGFVTSSTMGLV